MARVWKPIVVIAIAAAVVGVVSVKSRKTDPNKLPAPSAVKTGQSAVDALLPKSERPLKPSPKSKTTAAEEMPASNPEAAPVKSVDPPKSGPDKASPQAKEDAAPEKAVVKPAAKTDPKPAAEKPKKLPKLVDFGAEWCGPCRAMAPILQELANQYAGQLEVVFVNTQDHPDLSELYGIEQIPTQIFYNADGVEFSRHVGFYPKDEILSTFRLQGIVLKPRSKPD